MAEQETKQTQEVSVSPEMIEAERLLADWVRDGGLTYRQLILELWRIGGLRRGLKII